MPYKVKVFMLVGEEEPEIYQNIEQAAKDADQVMFLHPGEVITKVVECDDNGDEL